MRRLLTAFVVGASGIVLAACPTLEPEEASRLATENVGTNLKGQSAALEFLSQSALVDRGLGSEGSVCEPGTPPEYCPEPADPFDLDAQIDELVTFLEQHVFVDANVESQNGGEVVYLLRPTVVCAEVTAPDRADCEAFFTDVEIRLVASSPGEGDLDLDILIGAGRVMPVSLRLHHDGLGATIDLDATAQALPIVATALGETIELPDVLTGEIDLDLHADAAQIFTYTASVLRAVQVTDGDLDVRISAATPVVSLTVDGATQQVTGALSFGPIDVQIPAADLIDGEEVCEADPSGNFECWTEASPLSGLFALHLPGLTGATAFDGTSDVLQLTGLGLGDGQATVTYASLPFLAVDVNATAGRTFDLQIAEAAGEGVDLTFTPSFELAVALDLARAAQEDPEIPAWTYREDLSIRIDGAAAPTLRMLDQVGAEPTDPDDPTPPPPPALQSVTKVLTGQLTLDGTSLSAPVVVVAGECLMEDTTVEGDVHPFSVLSAGVCE